MITMGLQISVVKMVSLFLALAMSVSAKSWPVYSRIQGMRNYWLVQKTDDHPSPYERVLDVVTGRQLFDSQYRVLATMSATAFTAADSNVVMYITSGADSSYLVALRLSPQVSRDTILAIALNDSRNWFSGLQFFWATQRDSIMIYFERESKSRFSARFVKIGPENTFEYRHLLSNTRGGSNISMDFSQIMFCVGKQVEVDQSDSSQVAVYDVQSDSIMIYPDACGCTLPPLRYSKSGSFIYIREQKGVNNIWEYLPGHTPHQVTEYQYPFTVQSMRIENDSLQMSIGNLMKSRPNGAITSIALSNFPNFR